MHAALSWRGGIGNGIRFASMGAVFCGLETASERHITGGRECWVNAVAAGTASGALFAMGARLGLQSSKYAVAMGAVTGLAVGLLEDVSAAVTGVSLKYPGKVREGAVELWIPGWDWERGVNGLVGITLALLSGTFVGASVVFTKKALRDMKAQGHDITQGSHEYLKNPVWWVGMTLTALGEVSNFGAYAFQPAILVTPLGAISVVISAVLSSIFLNEKLNFSGMVGCAQCLIGAVIIVFHSPSQSSTSTIPEFFHYVLQPVFLVYSFFVCILLCYLIFYLQPRYAQKSPLVYISISSLGGSYLVLATQGFGTSLVYSIRNWETDNQFLQWPIYPLLGFVVFFILFQVHFLNKALSSYSAAIVTPIYYVFFTTATMTSTAFLFQGFPVGGAINGVSILFGFLTIVGGVALLFQYSLKLQEIARQAGGGTVARRTTTVNGDHVSIPGGLEYGLDEQKPDEVSNEELGGRNLSGTMIKGILFGSRNNAVGGDVSHPHGVGASSGTLAAEKGKMEVEDSSAGVTSQEFVESPSVMARPKVIHNRPSLVIDGDGVDESDEVTSISHALVPGLRIVKMMPSLLHFKAPSETGTHHQHRSASLGADPSLLSWIRRKSSFSAQSDLEADGSRVLSPVGSSPSRQSFVEGGPARVRNSANYSAGGSVEAGGSRKTSKGSNLVSFTRETYAGGVETVQEEGGASDAASGGVSAALAEGPARETTPVDEDASLNRGELGKE
ncbi:hypothetical protein HDU98_008124 [Podochytrium sp. JEL0797]|nr:hypothetical protein HDU98_008124 [Podochytrium sp. JEL0797]